MSGLDILLLIFFHNRFDLFNFVDSPSYVKLKIFKNLCLLKYYEFVFYAMYFKIRLGTIRVRVLHLYIKMVLLVSFVMCWCCFYYYYY